jgi:hypothetical protein
MKPATFYLPAATSPHGDSLHAWEDSAAGEPPKTLGEIALETGTQVGI